MPQFQEACNACLNEEGFYGTANHYFDAKFLEDELCPPKLIRRFKEKAEQVVGDRSKTTRHSSGSNYYVVNVDCLVDCLEEAKAEVAREAVHTDLLENQKKRLYSAVKAHYELEKKTFVDNLLKKTKDILIKGHREWIERDLIRSEKILENAKEDENVTKLREELKGKVERLQECMLLLRDVPLPDKTNGSQSESEDEQGLIDEEQNLGDC